jgi:hypothetical protein
VALGEMLHSLVPFGGVFAGSSGKIVTRASAFTAGD